MITWFSGLFIIGQLGHCLPVTPRAKITKKDFRNPVGLPPVPEAVSVHVSSRSSGGHCELFWGRARSRRHGVHPVACICCTCLSRTADYECAIGRGHLDRQQHADLYREHCGWRVLAPAQVEHDFHQPRSSLCGCFSCGWPSSYLNDCSTRSHKICPSIMCDS